MSEFKKYKVESFNMDHTKVKAPFVRKAGVYLSPHEDIITKYDLRFTQPNQDFLPTCAAHGLEHLMATYIRDEDIGKDVIDLSPMGCRTGFSLTMFGEHDLTEIKDALVSILKKVVEADEMPAANAVQCGNYRDLNLEESKKFAQKMLSEDIKVLEVYETIV